MRKLISITVFILCLTGLSAKTIIDMAGRSIEIPDDMERILSYDSKTALLLFPVAYEKMVAKAFLPGSKKSKFISDKYNLMPEVDIKNIEAVFASNAQIIIAGTYISSNKFERFDKLQRRTHIPVVIVDLSIDKLDKTYAFLKTVIGNEKQCLACELFLQQLYNHTYEIMSKNSCSNANVYYSIGGSGLMTDPSGSKHTEVFDYLKLNNVVKVDIPTGGHANVNMEQVLEWNPENIFAAGFKGNINAYLKITTDSKWATINAVKKGCVYKVPSLPFGWFDHPPSINRVPGIVWLSQLFYQLPKAAAQKQIMEFYKLFYKYELSITEYNLLFE